MSRFSDFVDAVESNLGDSTVKFVNEFPERKGQHGGRRRIHWYLQGGEIDKAHQSGGRETNGNTVREPAIYNRLERIQANVMAESWDSLDTLLDNLIVAIDHASPNGGVEFGAYDLAYDQYNKRVPMVALVFDVKLPVSDEQKPLTVLTGEGHTCEYEIPSVSIFAPVFATVFG